MIVRCDKCGAGPTTFVQAGLAHYCGGRWRPQRVSPPVDGTTIEQTGHIALPDDTDMLAAPSREDRTNGE
jgi:hypothetical protein